MTLGTTRWWIVVGMLALVAGASWTVRAEQGPQALFERARLLEENSKTLGEAITLYKQVVAQAGSNRALAAQALLRTGECYQKLGDPLARSTYERILQEFSDQTAAVRLARARIGSGRSTPENIKAERVWGPTNDEARAVSADGRYLCFVDRVTGNLAVRDLATRQDRQLTNNARPMEYAQEASFSPDGRRVAYAWFNQAFRYDLRIVDISGTINTPRILYSNEDLSWIGPYDWSPDGQWIAVQIQRRDRSAQIGLISAGGGTLRVLKSVEWRGSTGLSFSPDGRYLAFDLPADQTTEQRDVFALAIDGSRQLSVVAEPADETVVGWTEDGQLIYNSDRAGSNGLWAIPISGAASQARPRSIRPDINATFSRITRSGRLYFAKEIGGNDIIVKPFDSEARGELSGPSATDRQFIGDNRHPDWSADGQFLAYTSWHRGARGSSPVLVIRSTETGADRQLHPALTSFNFPRWAPDSRSLLVGGTDAKGRSGIHRVDANDGRTDYIAPGQFPQWSSDAKRIYYRRNTQQTQVLVERDLSSGDERELLRGEERWLRISPDGKSVVGHSLDRSTLFVADLSTGKYRELLRLQTGQIGNTGTAWTPDGKALIFVKTLSADNRETEVWLVPFPAGEPRRLQTVNADSFHFHTAVHPAGNRIAINVGNTLQYELWTMDNFLSAVQP